MNALTQYIDLYKAHHPLIEKSSAEALGYGRHAAMLKLEQCQLPAAGSENYECTDLNAMLAPDFGINLADVSMDVNPELSFRCGVPDMNAAHLYVLNDSVRIPESTSAGLPEGVEVCSLRDMARKNPDFIRRYYGAAADADNPLVALDTMLMRDGICIHVGKGIRLEHPLQLVNILAGSVPLMAVRRLLIVVDDDAEATLVACDHTQTSGVCLMSLQTIEIFVGERARFDYYDLEESSKDTRRLSTLWLRQEAESNVMIDGITLYNGETRNEYYCRFQGEHAELRLFGMGIEDKERRLDSYSYVDHAVGKCHTEELFKYVVDDHAAGAFAGIVYVAPGASGTEAYQSNRNIVGSGDARMWSKPQLEIYNDDVKCSHGTATGQLDSMQLFYMRTRGLSDETARLLLKQAFMSDVIEGVRLESLRERLHHLVEHRFAGESASCAGCAICPRD